MSHIQGAEPERTTASDGTEGDQNPRFWIGVGVGHRLRRPGRSEEMPYPPGTLASRSVRFAGGLIPRSLPHAETVSAGPGPGRLPAGALRTEVPVHRLSSVQAAGSMVVPRDLLPLQAPPEPPG